MSQVRKTKSVEKVLHLFELQSNAISAIELVEKLDKNMNKTTVYRILDRLENKGLLHSIMGRDGLKWYAKCKDCSSEKHTDAHPHFQCTNCGKVDCLDIEVLIPQVKQHNIKSAELFLIGECNECRMSQADILIPNRLKK